MVSGVKTLSDDQKMITKQTDLVLQLLNLQRHDWLNHVQVLMSYLKLGRPERAEEYLKRVTELTFQEGMISRIQFPQLAVFLLSFHALHNELRLDVEMEGPIDFSTIDIDRESVYRFLTGLVFAVQEHLDSSAPDAASMLISFSQTEEALVIRFDLDGMLTASGEAIVAKMVEQQSAACMTEWIHTEEEWLLETRFLYRM